MKRLWVMGGKVIMWLVIVAIVAALVEHSRTTLNYSSVCKKCLQETSSSEKSIVGFIYHREEKSTRPLYDPDQRTVPAKPAIEKIPVYERIYGHPCQHDCMRVGFCRYGRGVIACGHFGGSAEFRQRNEVVRELFRTFGRMSEKELAVRTGVVIDRVFPIDFVRKGNFSESDRERYKRLELTSGLLGVVRTPSEWEAALAYLESGFQGTPPLLKDPAGLSERLRSDDPAVRRAAASALAGEPSTSAELMEEMLRHGDKDVVEVAGKSVFYGKRFPLFGAMLRSFPLDEYNRKNMRGYVREDFETLFLMNDPVVDAACLEAISKGDRFELLELALGAVNRDPSGAGSQAIKRLLRGPNPFFESEDRDSDAMWTAIETIHAPIAELRVSMMTDIGPNRRERSKYNFMSAIKSIGAEHDVPQWRFLRDGYLKAIDGGTAEWWLACMAKAMHELDAPATETFLIEEIKGSDYRRLSAAFSSMGLIAVRNFEKPLDEFVAHPPEPPSNGINPPKYYFFGGGYGPRFLKYALHRCRGIPSWTLIKGQDGRYVIAK